MDSRFELRTTILLGIAAVLSSGTPPSLVLALFLANAVAVVRHSSSIRSFFFVPNPRCVGGDLVLFRLLCVFYSR